MKKSLLFFTILILALFLFIRCDNPPTSVDPIETSITGRVIDQESNEPLSGVSISTVPTTNSVTTDNNGNYSLLSINPGDYTVTGKKSGYINNSVNVVADEGKEKIADMVLAEIKPELVVTPSYINFSTNEVSKTIILTNGTEQGEIEFTVSENLTWLSLDKTSGTITNNSTTITALADRSAIDYGSYDGEILINSSIGTKRITVQLVKENPNAPQLTVTPTLLEFGSTNSELALQISNTGTGELSWSVTPTEGWISTSSNSGSIGSSQSSQISINVSRSGLQPGNYTGALQFSSNGTNTTVTVTMRVSEEPLLTVTPSKIDFGEHYDTRSFNITNEGTGDLNWEISENIEWLSVNKANGTGNTTITATVNRSGLEQGVHEEFIRVTSNAGSRDVSARLEIAPPPPPDAVTLATPSNVSTNSVTLQWESSGVSDFKEYKLFYATSENVNENNTEAATITNRNSNSYEVTGLNDNTTYFFRIFTYNEAGSGAGSNVVSVTTNRDVDKWVTVTKLDGLGDSDYHERIFANSNSDVWVVGNDIWNYNGSNWTKKLKPDGSGFIPVVYFVNNELGFAGGDKLLTYEGSSWLEFSEQPPINSDSYKTITGIVATSENDIWIIRRVGPYSYSGYTLYHYNGSNWSEVVLADDPYDLEIDNSGTIYVSSTSSEVFYKNEGNGFQKFTNENIGRRSKLSSPVSGTSFIYDTFSYNRFLVYESGNVQIIDNDFSGLNGGPIEMLSSSSGWIVDFSKLYYFNRSSITLQEVQNPSGERIAGIHFIDESNGWAITYNGTVMRYVD